MRKEIHSVYINLTDGSQRLACILQTPSSEKAAILVWLEHNSHLSVQTDAKGFPVYDVKRRRILPPGKFIGKPTYSF